MFNFPQSVSRQDFIRHYWQKRPLLFPAALERSNTIISSDTLLSLACDEAVESRLIIHDPDNGDYDVIHGPQDPELLRELQQTDNWTLLVQSVNLWNSDVARIINHLNFIPHWRYDDIMISFSTKGGGVGPHTDHYDVFLLQLDGKRQWRVGTQHQFISRMDSRSELQQVEPFDAQIESVLQPGDMIYVPPETPHEGTSTSIGMTLSIGFRSPSSSELASMLSEELSRQTSYYEDACDPSIESVAELTTEAMIKARDWFQGSLDEQLIFSAFGKLQTQPKQELLLYPLTTNPRELLKSGETLFRDPAARIAWWRHDDDIRLFVNGEEKRFPVDDLDMINFLSLSQDIDLDMISAYIGKKDCDEILLFLTDCGFYGTIE